MKSTVRKLIPSNYNPLSPTPPAGLGLQVDDAQFEQALVLDVITNDEHELYRGGEGFNVGMVKFQFRSDDLMPESTFAWAYPMFSNITNYPLKGEIVYIFRSMKRWWYLMAFNVSNRVTTQDLPELLNENKPQKTHEDTSKEYTAKRPSVKKGNIKSNDNTVGQYFKDLPDVYRLKHTEGDIILEGRSGASIRFGTSWTDGNKPFLASNIDQSPNVIIRVGADPKAKKSVDTIFGLVMEDINTDATSFWMVSDQFVKLDFSTKDSKIHGISVPDYPKTLENNQAILNSDRVVLNAKKDKIILDAANGIHLTSLKSISFDTDSDHKTWTIGARTDNVIKDWKQTIAGKWVVSAKGDISHITNGNQILTAKGNANVIAKKIHIGSDSATEPLVLGNVLQQFLNELMTALVMEPLVMITGSPGSPSSQSPTRIAKLNQLKQQYLSGKILSDDNFTIKKNATPPGATNISPYNAGS
jgi:hypothetical protein